MGGGFCFLWGGSHMINCIRCFGARESIKELDFGHSTGSRLYVDFLVTETWLFCVPRSEHAKRSPDCGFLQMKSFEELTAIEFFRLEHGRIRNYIVRKTAFKKRLHMFELFCI